MKNHVMPLLVTLALLTGIQLACAQPALIPLYSFTGGNDGANPLAGLVQASDGNLYGTASAGGPINSGTIFRITASGVLTPLYSFTNGNDGATPIAGLMQASDGNLYGTASAGGANGFGTIFRITTNDVFTPLYSFTNGNDGATPYAGLVQASDGNLYGTAIGGGTNDCGTIFRITTSGVFTPLYSFTFGNDGGGPEAGLVQASDGNLYGTAYLGGTNGFFGTIFRITTNSVFTPLYSFSNGNDGAYPVAGLVQASDGNLYGTAEDGGTIGDGTIFRITTNGVFTSLYSFTYGNDGANPTTALVQASNGNLYGTTIFAGGFNSYGTVFEYAIAPPPLGIFASSNQSILFWPAWATNCIVQSTTDLASPNWVTLSNAVVTIATTNTVTVTNALSAQFFRLATP